MADSDLLREIRREVYLAKKLVRSTRNHTKLQAAALQDSEDRIDALIERLENPHAQGGPGSNGRQEASAAQAGR